MAAKTDNAGRRVAKKGEAPKALLVDKDITAVMTDFVAYIKEQTGYDADARSVQLGAVLRGEFQKSEGNQSRIAERKQALIDQAAAREERRAERAQAKIDREAARAAKAEERANAPKVEKAAPTKATKAAPAKTAAASKTPASGRKAPGAGTKTAAAPAAKAAPTNRRRPAAKGAANSDF